MPTSPTWEDTIDDSPSWEDTEAEESLRDILRAEQPTLPPPVPSTGIPEIPESIAPIADWTQRQREESFVPSMKDIQLEVPGLPSRMGITPESVPSGRRIAESPFGGVGFGLAGLVAPELPSTVASSVGKTAIGVGEYLSSPQGIVELVGSATPAKLAVLAKWAYDMSKGAYTEASEFGTLLAKENKTPEDRQKLMDHAVNALAMGLGAGGVVKHGARDVNKLVQSLNTPEGKIRLQDRGEVLQQMFNEYEARRQAESGSPFTLLEPPTSPISMGVRTQPALSGAPTFEPSRIPMGGELPIPSELGAIQPPAPPMAPGPRPVRATTQVRLQGEAVQRAADFEKAMAERVAQEQAAPAHPDKPLTANQLRIIQDSLRNEILSGQIGRDRPGVISGGALEAWADKVFQDAKDQNLRFSGGDTKMIAAGVVKAAALLERGIIDVAQWTAAMVKEFGESIRPFLNDIRSQAEQLRLSTQKGGEKDAIQQKAEGAVRNVQQPEITQEGAGQVPAREGSAQAAETRVITEQSLAEMPPAEQARVGHGPGIEYGITLTEADVPRLEAGYAKAGKEMVDASLKGDGLGQQAAFGRMNFYGGALQGATRGKHKAAATNYELFKQRREAEGRPIPEPAKGGEPVEKAKEEKPVLEPEVEGVTALDPQSGTPLSAIESLINRLESLKFSEQGLAPKLYTLDPKIIQRVGKQLWNDAISTAQFAIRAGKSIAEAIDAALEHIRKTRTGIDEAPMRAELQRILGPETPETPAARPAATPPPVPAAAPVDPITGEPARIVSEKEAKAMERKVKLPAETDVRKLAEQIDLFNKEIGDALETGGQFLPKELRPDVAKGAPAEKGTVTNKQINQYFVNKLSSIRKDLIAAGNRIKQQADIESQTYFDLLQKRFEQAFRQVQELRRTSHESLYFWNKIKAEYQAIAHAAGAMPEMKRWLPVFDSMVRDLRLGKREQALRTFAEFLRLNQFNPGSWTLDFGTNLAVTATRLPAWAIMDMGALITGRPPSRMATAVRALADNMRNWNPFGKRFRLPDKLEMELGNTIGGEFGGRGREIFFDFSEILKDSPQAAERLRHLDKLASAPVRMKRAVDGFFGRLGATAELYHRAYIEGKTRGLKGDELKTFTEEFVRNPPEVALDRAIKAGKEFKFNRDIMPFEERFANSLGIKLFVETYPRWTLQFIRWAGEMTGLDPVFARKLLTGKATGEEAIKYLTKAATGWGGIYAFNQLFYENVDSNSMEYVKEDGNRIRLSGRTPVPEIYFVCAVLRGDTVNAKAALPHLSLPLAKVFGGEPGGLLSPFIKTFSESLRGNYTADQTARELNNLVNNMIPGKTMLGLIRAFFDPTIREGIGSPIPGVSSALPQSVDPTTGEPRAPKQRIPGTKIEIPTVAGTPFPGAERVLNEVESALLDHGLGNVRPRRTSIIDLPAEDVPKPVRKEYEQMVGRNVKELIGEEIKSPDFWKETPDIRREILSQLLTEARSMARDDLADKYGTSGEPVKSVPLNVQRLPKRFR